MPIAQETNDLRHFAGWPLLPLTDGMLHPLLPLDESPVLRVDVDWPPELPMVLLKLGCRCVGSVRQASGVCISRRSAPMRVERDAVTTRRSRGLNLKTLTRKT